MKNNFNVCAVCEELKRNVWQYAQKQTLKIVKNLHLEVLIIKLIYDIIVKLDVRRSERLLSE